MKKLLIGGFILIAFIVSAPTIMKIQPAFSQKAIEPPGQVGKSPPPGFDQGKKQGWEPMEIPQPPGFDQGKKQGWEPMPLPPTPK
jgi:hypothetical protein